MTKMVVLKPILWNPTGYVGPSGEVTSSGYADENGYGHEEWNGRDDWIWQGWRVFDTQSQPRLDNYADSGDLAIIMITVVGGRPCVVGVAANVYANAVDEQRAIARELRLKVNGAKVWALPAVQDRFGTRAAFNTHWNSAYSCVRWRCTVTHYHWLRERVHFDPNSVAPRLPPREKVVAMHSSYQSILPEHALALLQDHLPPSHPILGWLSEGEFDIVEDGRKRSTASKAIAKVSAGRRWIHIPGISRRMKCWSRPSTTGSKKRLRSTSRGRGRRRSSPILSASTLGSRWLAEARCLPR